MPIPDNLTPVIILVEPQLPENIGTTARAMANFGLSRLRLVNPRGGWPNEKARPAATGAALRATGALAVDYPSPVAIHDGAVYRDGDRVVAGARVSNSAERNVRVLVIGAFYDAAGRPMTRPFDIYELDGQSATNVQFVGPSGSQAASRNR